MTSKNWRDIDLSRDRGQKKDKKKSSLEERAEKLASKEARKELDKLFKSSPLNKEKAAELDRIRSLRGGPDFYKAMDAYIEKYDTPREWEAQSLFLDHKDPKMVIRVLDQLLKSAPSFDLSRQQVLGQKLRVMEVSSFDPELIQKVRQLKEALLQK